ncbi:MAG TPA: N-acetylmuramoyl-L-alanine amidase, partial [Rhodanobacteraceae bacterium]|nr:N-acetylmuramoyl-L-alanine amidase [Rhodanobacteraceae bacterium]
QGASIQASDAVAKRVLKALAQLGPTHRGYVERANFVVLRSPDVPSILVETAFITNPVEERKLRDADHRKQLAQAILSGVRGYFESTPPPGTWFAAVRSGRIHPGETDASTLVAAADDSNDDGGAGTRTESARMDTTAHHDGDVGNAVAKPARLVVAQGPRVRPPASDEYIEVVSDVPPPPVLPSPGGDDPDRPATLDANVRDMHRVLRGETLSGIAQQYGVSLGALRSLNRKIPDDGSVQAGQVLLIPSS